MNDRLTTRLDLLAEATVQANHPEATRPEWNHWQVEADRARAEIVQADRRCRIAFRVVAATVFLSLTASMFLGWEPGAVIAVAGLAVAAVVGKDMS